MQNLSRPGNCWLFTIRNEDAKVAGEMDSNEIDVHDATVRREPSRGSVSQGSSALHVDSQVGSGSKNSGVADNSLEEAKTVISASHGSSVPSQPADGGSPAEVTRVLLGHQLDHFYLENLIGGGGMGAVFRARDTRLDRIVAIKVIPRVGDDAELQRRFRNEAQSAARLDHPNIARVYDVGQHGGWHYIVFEYIDGINLRDLVHRDGVLSIDDAVYYTRQVAEALDHAHRRGVVHRDIKPSNVLITTTGQAKLVDMGLARAQQLEMSEDMTASGVTLGTFDYISPEQARDPRDADVRSDIYSLGCTLYFSLTGRAPYPSGTVLQKLLSHGSSPPPDPRRVRKELSSNLVAVLHKMLAKQPNDRYRRPLDLISDLYQLAELERLPRSLSAGSIAIAPTNRFARLLEYHLPWVIAVLLLFLSAGWMQLLSSASSDLELTTIPPRAEQPANTSDTGSVSQDSGSSGSSTTPQRPAASQTNTAAEKESFNNTQPAPTTSDVTSQSNAIQNSDSESSLPSDELAALGPSVISPTPRGLGTSVTNSSAIPVRGNESADNVSGAGSSDTSPTSPVAKQKRVIRVLAESDFDDALDIPEDRLVVESLVEAFEVAKRDNELTIIEVQGTVSIGDHIKLPRKGLTIRGVSESSVLDFGVWVPSDSENPWLFDLDNYNLDLENLHIVWQIPSMAMTTGSIFRMAGGNTIRLSSCTITIDDPDLGATANAFVYSPDDRAASLESNLPQPTIAQSVSPSTAGMSKLVAIQLKNCVVRGGMSLLNLQQSGLMELKWDNGLLCIDGSMVRTTGAANIGEFSSARARIIMNDVTAVMGKSLIRVELEGGLDQPISVDREANRCVFSWPSSEPLIGVDGVSPDISEDRLLTFRGSDNHYDSAGDPSKPILLWSSDDSTINKTVTIADFLGMNPPRWAQDASAQGVVNWSYSLPDRGTLQRATPTDFLQEGVVLPGFRIAELPRFNGVQNSFGAQ